VLVKHIQLIDLITHTAAAAAASAAAAYSQYAGYVIQPHADFEGLIQLWLLRRLSQTAFTV
jgi:hypothetical protein